MTDMTPRFILTGFVHIGDGRLAAAGRSVGDNPSLRNLSVDEASALHSVVRDAVYWGGPACVRLFGVRWDLSEIADFSPEAVLRRRNMCFAIKAARDLKRSGPAKSEPTIADHYRAHLGAGRRWQEEQSAKAAQSPRMTAAEAYARRYDTAESLRARVVSDARMRNAYRLNSEYAVALDHRIPYHWLGRDA